MANDIEIVGTLVKMDMERLISIMVASMGAELITPVSHQLERMDAKMTLLVGVDGNNGELSRLKNQVHGIEDACRGRVCIAQKAEEAAAAEKIARAAQVAEEKIALAEKAKEEKLRRISLRNWLRVSAVGAVLCFATGGVSCYNTNQSIKASLKSAETQRTNADERAAKDSTALQIVNDQAASDRKELKKALEQNKAQGSRNRTGIEGVQTGVDKLERDASAAKAVPPKKHWSPF